MMEQQHITVFLPAGLIIKRCHGQLVNQCCASTNVCREWCCHLPNTTDSVCIWARTWIQEPWIRILNWIAIKIWHGHSPPLC